MHVGIHKITIIITDDNPAPLSSTYNFEVTVISNGDNSANSSESVFEGIKIPEEPGINAS